MWLFVLCFCILVFFVLFWALLLIFWILEPGIQPQLNAPPFHLREERCGLDKRFEFESWYSFDSCVFILIYRRHPNRWIAVVPDSIYLILAVVPWDSYTQHLVKHGIDPSFGFSAFTSTMLLSLAFEKKRQKGEKIFFNSSECPYLCFNVSFEAFYFCANLGFQTVINSKSIFYPFLMVQLQLGITVIVLLHLKHI